MLLIAQPAFIAWLFRRPHLSYSRNIDNVNDHDFLNSEALVEQWSGGIVLTHSERAFAQRLAHNVDTD